MIELKINGEAHTVEAEPDTPLLWVLRDHLGLTGTKYGCGQALCGACTVHLDGRAARACVTPVSKAAKHEITTIEGLSKAGEHPVQQAWVRHSVPQCGFCQAGQIMSAVALLREVKRPTEEQIDKAMAGNLCRCGTYLRIRAAILDAAGGA